MAKLKHIAEERGIPLEELIPLTIKEEGSILRAALALGVTPTSIHYWIEKNGYRLVTRQIAILEKDSSGDHHAA